VNASTEDASERVLNVRIVDLTMLMAELEGGVPMLVQAWAPFGERLVQSHSSAEAFNAFVEHVRERTAADLSELAQSFGSGLSRVPTIHRRGTPDEVIPELVATERIDLVVMGTVGRAGIAGFLIGNTAERLLRTLTCSVLAVKPDGFVSPVGLESA
jgi:nucleotide-binding universal stress UspA family protein